MPTDLEIMADACTAAAFHAMECGTPAIKTLMLALLGEISAEMAKQDHIRTALASSDMRLTDRDLPAAA